MFKIFTPGTVRTSDSVLQGDFKIHILTKNKYITMRIAYNEAVFTIYYYPLNVKMSLLLLLKEIFLCFGLKVEGPNEKLLSLVCGRNESVQTYGLN